MDQYDNPKARYALVIGDEGQVLAGARALPTSARWGDITYMLRDAQDGRIGGIPADLLGERILPDTMYECTRLVISPELRGDAGAHRLSGADLPRPSGPCDG